VRQRGASNPLSPSPLSCEIEQMRISRLGMWSVLSALVACSQGDKKPRLPDSAVVGVWKSDTVRSPVAPGRVYQLATRPDGFAELSSELGGADRRVERGTWDGADSLVRVVVRGDATGARASSLLLAMRNGTLALIQFDTASWGREGLVFRR
jgi:hypothetical protein